MRWSRIYLDQHDGRITSTPRRRIDTTTSTYRLSPPCTDHTGIERLGEVDAEGSYLGSGDTVREEIRLTIEVYIAEDLIVGLLMKDWNTWGTESTI